MSKIGKKSLVWILALAVVLGGATGLAAGSHASTFNVETGDAVFVDDRFVTVEANVTSLGNASSAEVRVQYRPNGTTEWNTTANRTTAQAGTVYFNLTDLDPGTDYEYRAIAVASNGEVDTGSTRLVRTDSDPAVETTGSSGIGESSASLHGNLVDLGGADSATVGFEYRQVGSSTWLATDGNSTTSAGPYSADVTGLASDTDYEFHAVAEASDGETAIGVVRQFSTDVVDIPPSVDQLAASEDNPNNRHAGIDVTWQVSDPDANLDTVEVTVRDAGGQVVLTDLTTVAGSSASGSLSERIKHGGGQTYTVSVSVTDAAGHETVAETTVDA